jgi:hypothetical protein
MHIAVTSPILKLSSIRDRRDSYHQRLNLKLAMSLRYVDCSEMIAFYLKYEIQEPANHQMRIFVDEVQQLRMIPILRGYLKLYTSLTVSKLAAFMELSEAEVQAKLMCFKVVLVHAIHNTFAA